MEGPDSTDTPANGGSRGAAPPWRLNGKDGQRPTIHRLHQRRRPRGPRASATPAELAFLRASQRPGSLSDTFHRRGHRRAPGRTLRTPAGSGLTSGCNCRKMRRALLRRMTAPDSEARPLCGPSATSHRETAGLARKFVPAPADRCLPSPSHISTDPIWAKIVRAMVNLPIFCCGGTF